MMYAAGAKEGLPSPDPTWFEPLSVSGPRRRWSASAWEGCYWP